MNLRLFPLVLALAFGQENSSVVENVTGANNSVDNGATASITMTLSGSGSLRL